MKKKNTNEVLKRHFEVDEIRNGEIDKVGTDETKKTRTVILKSLDGRKITITGERDQITGFIAGDNVEVRITKTQTELFKEEKFDEVDDLSQ